MSTREKKGTTEEGRAQRRLKRRRRRRIVCLLERTFVCMFAVTCVIGGVLFRVVTKDRTGQKKDEYLNEHDAGNYQPLEQQEIWENVEGVSLHMKWYLETEGLSFQEKKKIYSERLESMCSGQKMIMSKTESELNSEEKADWNLLYEQIQGMEKKKVPEEFLGLWPGHFEEIPVEKLNILNEKDYEEIGMKCREAGSILPQSTMKQHEARNFGDAMLQALATGDWNQAREHAEDCVEAYEGLFCFSDRSLSDGEIYAWIGDTFYQLYCHCEFREGILTPEQQKEHCRLMVCASLQLGSEAAGTGSWGNNLQRLARDAADIVK